MPEMYKLKKITNVSPTPRYRVIAKKNYRNGVNAGDKGGIVTGEHNLQDEGWVSYDSYILDNAVVKDLAVVEGKSLVTNNAVVSSSAIITGGVSMFDSTQITDSARLSGDINVFDDVLVKNNALVVSTGNMSLYLSGKTLIRDWTIMHAYGAIKGGRFASNARVNGQVNLDSRYGGAAVHHREHHVSFGPFGSERRTATLTRMAKGHLVTVGCWSGVIDDLMPEVKARREELWDSSDAYQDMLEEEYRNLTKIFRSMISRWSMTD